MGKLERSRFHGLGGLEPGHEMGARFGRWELGFLPSLFSLFVPYSRLRFLGERIYLTSLSSYSYFSRQECDIFIVRFTMQWRMGSSWKKVWSSFTLHLVVCWNQLALAHHSCCAQLFPTSCWGPFPWGLESGCAGSFIPWQWANNTHQALFSREPVVRHLRTYHCLPSFPFHCLISSVVFLIK